MIRKWLLTILIIGAVVAALGMPLTVSAQDDPPLQEYRTAAGLILAYAPDDAVVMEAGDALTVVSLRAPHVFTIFGPDAIAALLDPADDDGSLTALVETFAASFGAGQALDRDAEEPLDRDDGEALIIPFSREGMTGAALLARLTDERTLIVIGVSPDTTTAADLNAEIGALLAGIRFDEPVEAASDGLITLGEVDAAAITFALPEGFRAAPAQADTPIVLLDTLPDPALYVQATVRLNADDALTADLWKAQFFAGLAEQVGDDGYDAETSWTLLTEDDDAPQVEVYRAIGLDDELSALGYLITLSPDAFVVISAQTPDAAALEARAEALDALALSVRLNGGE